MKGEKNIFWGGNWLLVLGPWSLVLGPWSLIAMKIQLMTND